MKTWKTVVCLLLLCVIIGGCVALGKSTEVAATQAPPIEAAPPQPEAQAPTTSAPESGSAITDKTYSEGLYFRSNGDGTCALAGMGSCTAACILIPPKSPAGDIVTEILPHALAYKIFNSMNTCSLKAVERSYRKIKFFNVHFQNLFLLTAVSS